MVLAPTIGLIANAYAVHDDMNGQSKYLGQLSASILPSQ